MVFKTVAQVVQQVLHLAEQAVLVQTQLQMQQTLLVLAVAEMALVVAVEERVLQQQ
jgi:hypothetical protein